MNIVDIKHIEQENQNTIPTNIKIDKRDRVSGNKQPVLSKVEKLRLIPQSPAVVGGMSQTAHNIFDKLKHDKTKEEIGIGSKRIIIPSFGTTAKLFAQHFHILRELRHKIDLLKQAYEN